MNAIKDVFGIQSPPPAPDYSGAAQATAAGNLEAAKYATRANRANQVTPYGNLTWSNDGKDNWTQRIDLNSTGQQLLDADNQSALGLAGLQNQATSRVANQQAAGWNDAALGSKGTALDPNRVTGGGLLDMSRVREGASIDPSRVRNGNVLNTGSLQQGNVADLSRVNNGDVLDRNLAYGGGGALQSSPYSFNSRNIGDSSVGDNTSYYDSSRVGDVGRAYDSQQDTNNATNAILSRVNPQLDRRRNSEETKLINQGITRGSEAWRNAQTDLGQAENDAYTQAGLQGINLGMQQQGQTYGQTMSNRGALTQDQQILASQQMAGRSQDIQQSLANQNNQQTNASRALSADQASANINLGAQQQSFNQNLANSNQLIGAQNQAFNQNQANNDQYLRGNQQAFNQTQANNQLNMAGNQQAFGQDQANNAMYLQMQNQGFGQNQANNAQYLAGQGQLFGQQNANNSQYLAAQNQGFNQANALRAAGLQEQNYFNTRDLNNLNALRSGSQVTNPTFNSYAQQGQTTGPDMLGAAQAGYNAQLGAVNANNAFGSGMMNGLFSLGGSYLGRGS